MQFTWTVEEKISKRRKVYEKKIMKTKEKVRKDKSKDLINGKRDSMYKVIKHLTLDWFRLWLSLSALSDWTLEQVIANKFGVKMHPRISDQTFVKAK